MNALIFLNSQSPVYSTIILTLTDMKLGYRMFVISMLSGIPVTFLLLLLQEMVVIFRHKMKYLIIGWFGLSRHPYSGGMLIFSSCYDKSCCVQRENRDTDGQKRQIMSENWRALRSWLDISAELFHSIFRLSSMAVQQGIKHVCQILAKNRSEI